MTAEKADANGIAAPAKLNLYLHVVARRADSFHELDTLMAFTEYGDKLTIAPADDLSLEVSGPFADRLPPANENLVCLAAEALAKAAGIPPRAALHLEKRLPVAAGVGSGSADAAAALRGLAEFWSVSDVDLAEVALTIGSDVPACLVSKAVFVGGTGDVLSPGPQLPEFGVVMVNPGVRLVTQSVFEARRGGFSPEPEEVTVPEDQAGLIEFLARRGNDLAEPAIRLAPVIREVLAVLEAAPGCRLARMSGSGATCFGLFDDLPAAAAAAAGIQSEGWWVAATRFGNGP